MQDAIRPLKNPWIPSTLQTFLKLSTIEPFQRFQLAIQNLVSMTPKGFAVIALAILAIDEHMKEVYAFFQVNSFYRVLRAQKYTALLNPVLSTLGTSPLYRPAIFYYFHRYWDALQKLDRKLLDNLRSLGASMSAILIFYSGCRMAALVIPARQPYTPYSFFICYIFQLCRCQQLKQYSQMQYNAYFISFQLANYEAIKQQ